MINMLHYIYSRSFISIITFMALALAACLPAWGRGAGGGGTLCWCS